MNYKSRRINILRLFLCRVATSQIPFTNPNSDGIANQFEIMHKINIPRMHEIAPPVEKITLVKFPGTSKVQLLRIFSMTQYKSPEGALQVVKVGGFNAVNLLNGRNNS